MRRRDRGRCSWPRPASAATENSRRRTRGRRLDQVPPAVIKAAGKALPGVKLEDAWTNQGKRLRGPGQGDQDGKIRDAKATADGKVLEVE